jgi:glycosyltransferase involved in cell wall biosynthesis
MQIYKKKVLIVIGSFKIGGAEKMAINIGEELLKNDYDVNFAIQKPIFQIPNSIEKDRIHVLNKRKNSSKYFHHTNNIYKIWALGRKVNPDIVIGFTYFSSFLACFTFCKNIIGTFDVNPYSLGKKRHRIADFVCKWKNVKKIIGPSKGTVEEITEARPKYKNKFITIYNSIDFERVTVLADKQVAEMELISTKPYISAMGRLSEQKNFSLLISSYAKSEINKNLNLVIIGDGPLMEVLNKQIIDLNLNDKVFLLGFKSNPYPYIKNSRFLVNTSNYESFCIVILEALSLGKMVIASDCKSGPREMIVHDYNGFLFKTNDQTKLIHLLNSVAADDSIIDNKSSKAIESVSKFKLEHLVKEYIDLLEGFKNKCH